MDELAQIYIKDSGHTYRIKVFDKMTGVERQPDGDNKFYARPAANPSVFDGHAWNM